MSNLVYLTTVLVTNWTFTGDTKFQQGTNYIQLQAVVTRQLLVEEVTLCTNRTIYRVSAEGTNGVKWQLRDGYALPPAPMPLSLGQPDHL